MLKRYLFAAREITACCVIHNLWLYLQVGEKFEDALWSKRMRKSRTLNRRPCIKNKHKRVVEESIVQEGFYWESCWGAACWPFSRLLNVWKEELGFVTRAKNKKFKTESIPRARLESDCKQRLKVTWSTLVSGGLLRWFSSISKKSS